MEVIVTGGGGYIGSTICSALDDAGITPIIIDSFVTGHRSFRRAFECLECDIADKELVRALFKEHPHACSPPPK
ncbi:MAG: NAD-dependent epimerase/dehydratase family protein, partial [Proteobacteria bacterium]